MPAPPDLEHLPAARNPARPPLLFVHGAFGSPWMWLRRYMPWFAERGHDAYAVRLRRHGNGMLEPGLADYLEDLEAAVASIAEAPVVVGHSLGALVSQMALGRVPMRALALLAPVPPTGMVWSNLRLAVRAPELWLSTALSVADAGFASHRATRDALFTDDTCDTVVAETYANMRAQPARPLMEAQWPRFIARAASVDVPALTIAAERDQLIPVDAVERTARHHGARHVTLAGIGHALMLDTPWQQGAEALGEWLEEVAP